MKKMLVAMAMLILVSAAHAEKNRDEFGLGLVVGEPTGLNAQFFWDRAASVDVTAAWSWSEWLLLSADFQMYDYVMDMPREWKWYYGFGGYLSVDDDDDNRFGVRVPLGLRYSIPYTIMDVWAEAAPGMELAPDTKVSVQAGLGLTFWLW
ncbi:hypothetical protein IT157_08690 [bacterium]|nr:hypothetical protein [bacterium]